MTLKNRVVLCFIVALYLGLGIATGRSFFAWDEETTVQPGPEPARLATEPGPDGAARLEAHCRPHDPVHTFWQSARPNWNLCFAGRVWPLMSAPYLGGVAHWPTGLSSALLGDDLLRRRALSTLFGLVSLLTALQLAREFEGEDAVLPTALALATTPVFVLIHSLLLHYETLPSTLMMLAGLVCVRGARAGAAPR